MLNHWSASHTLSFRHELVTVTISNLLAQLSLKKKLVNTKTDKISTIYCDCWQTWYHFNCLQTNDYSISCDAKEEWICDNCAKRFDLFSDGDSDYSLCLKLSVWLADHI